MHTQWLFRHVHSVHNLRYAEEVGGRAEWSMPTEQGPTEALLLGRFLFANDIRPVAARTSPAFRAKFTGRLAFRVAGINMPIRADPRLHEMSQGDYEGKRRRKVYTPEVLAQIEQGQLDFHLPGGESMNMVGDRMLAWSEEQCAQSPDDTVVAFTHGVALRCLVGRLCGWGHARIRDETVDNAAGVRLLYDGSDLVDVRFNVNTQDTRVSLPSAEQFAA